MTSNDVLKTGGVKAVSEALNRVTRVPELSSLSAAGRIEMMQKITQSFSQNEVKTLQEETQKQAKVETVLGEEKAAREGILKQESERVSEIVKGKIRGDQSLEFKQKANDTIEK